MSTVEETVAAGTFAEFGLATPKFRIGQTVWTGGMDYGYEPAVCPDCKGAQRWDVTTPAGEDLQAHCPRCSGPHRHLRTYEVSTYKPKVQAFVVKAVEIRHGDVSYTLEGHQSSAERWLFATQAEAQAKAERECAEHVEKDETRQREQTQRALAALSFTNVRIGELEGKIATAAKRWDRMLDQVREMSRFTFIKEPASRVGGYLGEREAEAILRDLFEKIDEEWPVEEGDA